MGHSEVAQAPGQGGRDAQPAKGGRLPGGGVVALGQVEITGQGGGVGDHGIPAAGLADTEKDDDDQRNTHDNALHQVRGGHRQETAQHRITDNHQRANDHGCVVVHPQQAVEQGTHGLEAGGGIGDEENQDDDGGDAGQNVAFVTVAAGEEVGDGDCPGDSGIAAEPFCHNQPV